MNKRAGHESGQVESNGQDEEPKFKYRTPQGGIFEFLPDWSIPYAELMRLDRPAGFYAFYWHYAVGLTFAACISPSRPSALQLIELAAYLALFVVVLRGAVCTINDNCDQEFDRKVARTRFRPIARHAVSTMQANIFFALQSLGCAAILLPMPTACYPYAFATYLVLCIYPLGKRFTNFPQFILGFAFAIPVFMACSILGIDLLGVIFSERQSNLTEYFHLEAASLLFTALAIWTVIFDTVYAFQDIDDDKKAGVRSLTMLLGQNTRAVLGTMAMIQVGLQAVAGVKCGFGLIYFLLNVGGTGITLAIMIISVNLKDASECAWWFGPGSKIVGIALVSGLIGEYLSR